MDAFFYVDKPKGLTSFDVLREMKKKLHIKKMWHTGTLDPMATWVLLVATGNYTKLIPFFEKDSKTYEATIEFWGESPSYDADTQVNYISEEKSQEFSKTIHKKLLEKVIQENFIWDIMQIPPVYSALKIQGKTALQRTLQGEKVEMKERKVHIYGVEILEFLYPILRVKMKVSAGTYIRSFAHDLGEKLWCGGFLSSLRRVQIWNIPQTFLCSLENISQNSSFDETVLFPEKIFPLPSKEILSRLKNGQRVWWIFSFPENHEIILTWEGKLLCVCQYKQGVLHPRKIIIP